MGDFVKLSEAEMEVLRALWAGPRDGMTVAQVSEALPDKHWNYKTVGTFLTRMEEKGAVTAQRQGRANRYCPRYDEEAYKRMETEGFLQTVHNGSMKSLLVSLYDEAPDPAALEELKRWLLQQ